MANFQITEAGRKRVASDDFAKCLAHVIQQGGEAGALEDFVLTYVALNLLVDETGFAELPDDREKALHGFVMANMKEIKATVMRVLMSPAYIVHAMQCYGTDGLDEYLAQFPQA